MESLVFVALIAGVVAIAVVVARRPGRPAVHRAYDSDMGAEIQPHGDGGPAVGGGPHERGRGDSDGGGGFSGGDGGGFSGGGDGGN